MLLFMYIAALLLRLIISTVYPVIDSYTVSSSAIEHCKYYDNATAISPHANCNWISCNSYSFQWAD